MQVLLTVILEGIKCLVPPLERRFDLVVHRRKYVGELNNELEKLKKMKNDVQKYVNAALRNCEGICQVVSDWLTSVDTIETQVSPMFGDNEGTHNQEAGCFREGLSTRYRISKEAKEKIDLVKSLLAEGKQFNTNNVSHPPLPPSIEYTSTAEFEPFTSTKNVMNQIIEALKDEKISSVGIYGMGGIGKTTLIKVVGKKVEEDKLFDKVVRITISQYPDLKKIQRDIADELGLKFQEESKLARAERLSQRLNQINRVLIILDDLWERLELAEVGIPFGEEHKCCKVVITTRRLDVCTTMLIQEKFEVKVLSEQDSWQLFKKNAGDVVDSLTHRDMATEVARKCMGLPVAIVTLGRALREKDATVWAYTINQLSSQSGFKLIEGMDAKVFIPIKLSFDYLENEEIKMCFLFCCLFPEDYNIEMNELLMYVIGEGIFRNVPTLHEARLKLHTIVNKLKSSCLLLEGVNDTVVMHDVIRDVTMLMAKDDYGFIVEAGKKLRNWPENGKLEECKRMSLMRTEISNLPDQHECSQILSLSLRENRSLKDIPNSFFEGMTSLVTLYLSNTFISRVQLSVSCLTNLQTLVLEDRYMLIVDIPSLGNLKKLKILRLRNLFQLDHILTGALGELTNLKLLDLSQTLGPKTFPPNVISRLSRIEELYLGYGLSGWEIEESGDGSNASLFELRSLSRLTILQIHIENSKCLFKHIPIDWNKLVGFVISVGKGRSVPDGLRTVRLQFNEFNPFSDWVNVLLKKTENLNLSDCHGLRNVAQLEVFRFNNLIKTFHLQGCNDMEYLINLEEDVPFNSLEELYLRHLRNLKAISHGPIPNGLLNNLRYIKVSNCSSIVTLFSSDSEKFPRPIQNLKVVKVKGYDGLKYLISSTMVQILSQLEILFVERCMEMVEIISVADEIGVCGLRTPIFPNLRKITMSLCGNLKHIFPMRLAGGLQQLEEIYIDRCYMMEVIIAKNEEEEEEEIEENMNLPRLRKITLSDLPKLSNMWSGVVLPSLEVLIIIKCPNLKRIPVDLQIAPKLRKIGGQKDWFEGLECEDQSLKMHLRSLLQISELF